MVIPQTTLIEGKFPLRAVLRGWLYLLSIVGGCWLGFIIVGYALQNLYRFLRGLEMAGLIISVGLLVACAVMWEYSRRVELERRRRGGS